MTVTLTDVGSRIDPRITVMVAVEILKRLQEEGREGENDGLPAVILSPVR